MVVLLEIIAASRVQGDKVLVFSQRRPALDFVERVLMTKGWGGFVKTPAPAPVVPAWRLSFSGGAEEKKAGVWGPWENGRDYFRIDGSTNSKKRSVVVLPFFTFYECSRLDNRFVFVMPHGCRLCLRISVGSWCNMRTCRNSKGLLIVDGLGLALLCPRAWPCWPPLVPCPLADKS